MSKDQLFLPSELKQVRTCLGLTQEQLALELGVSRLSVVRWESGAYKIPFTVGLAVKYLEIKLMAKQD
jgi:DNA-binding XRE family transcriptional regulator